MAPVLKIRLIQFVPEALSPEKNFAKAAQEIRLAAEQGAHLAILPEYHLTSWVPEQPEFGQSCASCAGYLEKYQALAREHGIHIVPGTIIEVGPQARTPVAEGGEKDLELRNVSYFIAGGTGEILGSYQKKNLWHPERDVLTADIATPHTSFEIPVPPVRNAEDKPVEVIKVGLLICWDIAFPEPFRQLAMGSGAELIIAPAFWYTTGEFIDERVRKLNPNADCEFIDSVALARAYDNTCAVAFVNALGRSQVCVPIQGRVGAVEDGVEESMTCEVDFGVVRLAEDIFRVRTDVNGELWHYSRTESR